MELSISATSIAIADLRCVSSFGKRISAMLYSTFRNGTCASLSYSSQTLTRGNLVSYVPAQSIQAENSRLVIINCEKRTISDLSSVLTKTSFCEKYAALRTSRKTGENYHLRKIAIKHLSRYTGRIFARDKIGPFSYREFVTFSGYRGNYM